MSLRFSTSVTLMFREHAFLDRFAAAKAAGFDGVEIQVMEGGAAETAAAARDAGVEIVVLNAPLGDFLSGGAGLSGVPGREPEFRGGVEAAIAAACEMGRPFVHVGPSRVPDGASVDECRACFVDNINIALADADRRRIKLLLEPMNRADTPTALIGGVDEGAAFIREHFSGKLFLQFDIFHVARNGEDPIAKFREHRELIRHIQFSDVPGRGAPGTGELDFERIFGEIAASDYDGWTGAEYFPVGPTLETFGWREIQGVRGQ